MKTLARKMTSVVSVIAVTAVIAASAGGALTMNHNQTAMRGSSE
jgi:threonine/homoserine efflux transporter RhtA